MERDEIKIGKPKHNCASLNELIRNLNGGEGGYYKGLTFQSYDFLL